VGYFLIYLAYLSIHQEGEVAHWATLVAIPLLGVWRLSPRWGSPASLRKTARRLGLHWPAQGHGLVLALVLGTLVQGFQLMNGPQRRALWGVLGSSAAIWVVPASLLLVLLTAAFTEEFFFRGVLQRAISGRFGSAALGIAVTSVAFSLYHMPYAYWNPFWPSAGDPLHALQLAFVNGLLGGVVLGAVFVRSRGSILPGVLLHGFINWIPAVRAVGEAVGG
jgi:membrane protease YdiL (CAAX protease family)